MQKSIAAFVAAAFLLGAPAIAGTHKKSAMVGKKAHHSMKKTADHAMMKTPMTKHAMMKKHMMMKKHAMMKKDMMMKKHAMMKSK